MSASERILVAVDESQASRQAVDYVADMLCGKVGLHVGLVHIEWPPRMLEWEGPSDPDIDDAMASQGAGAGQDPQKAASEGGSGLLQRLKAVLKARGIDVIALLIGFEERPHRKHIAEDILKIAKERDYGTVVVGRHSFSALQRMFQHHVAEELVRRGEGITVWVVE